MDINSFQVLYVETFEGISRLTVLWLYLLKHSYNTCGRYFLNLNFKCFDFIADIGCQFFIMVHGGLVPEAFGKLLKNV